MNQCEAFLNGEAVGVVRVYEDQCRAVIQCTLPDGWIYRAVLFLNGEEIGRFGVLLPQTDGFFATLMIPDTKIAEGTLHCEVLRSSPGEKRTDGSWLTLEQLAIWVSSIFPLEESVLKIAEKKSGTLYRIYNRKRYLMLPMEFTKADTLAPLYCVGKPVELKGCWFLCIAVDLMGKIIPWPGDEN